MSKPFDAQAYATEIADMNEEIKELSKMIDYTKQTYGENDKMVEDLTKQQNKLKNKVAESTKMYEARTRQAYDPSKAKSSSQQAAEKASQAAEREAEKAAKAKGNKIRNTTREVAGYANDAAKAYVRLETIDFEKNYEKIAARTDNLLTDVEAATARNTMMAQFDGNAFSKSVEVGLSGITDSVNESAYRAARGKLDLSKEKALMNLEMQRISLETENTKNLRTAQKEGKLSDLGAEKTKAQADIGGDIAKAAGKFGGMAADAFLKTGGVGQGVGSAIGEGISSIATISADINLAKTQWENKLMIQSFENQKKLTEAQLKSQQEVEKRWIEAAYDVSKQFLEFAIQTEKSIEQFEKSANDIGISFGFTGRQLVEFKDSMFQAQVTAGKWNKTLEDIQHTQNEYAESSGRNIQFSTGDIDSAFAMDHLMGKDGFSAQFTSGMELFNHSVSDSNELLFEMFKDVSKIGLNGRKYAQDLVKNLRLAEKIQFKGGVKGLMEMSKWAQNTRFNMNNLENILQSFTDNGLEGAITKTAGMQVLGGNFARYADPLAMTWERYNDPMKFAQRQQDMLKGIGTFNSKTGEVDFNMNEQLTMEQFAKLSGQSLEDVRNQRIRDIKGQRVEKSLRSTQNFDEDEKALITNKAQLKNGVWTVVMSNNEEKAVSDLTVEDLNHLKPENNEEKLVEYVYDIRDTLTKEQGATKENFAQIQLDAWKTFNEEVEKRIANINEDFRKNYDLYKNNVIDHMKSITESQKSFLDVFNQGNSNVEAAMSEIEQAGQGIADTLIEVNKRIMRSMGYTEEQIEDEMKKQGLSHPNVQNHTLPNYGGSNGGGTGNTTYGANATGGTNGGGVSNTTYAANAASVSNASPVDYDKLNALQMDRSNSRDWLNDSDTGKKVFDDSYVDLAGKILDIFNKGNELTDEDLKNLSKYYADLQGMGMFDMKEDGIRTEDSFSDILKNLRELYLQGKINSSYKQSDGAAISEIDYLNSDYGKMFERAIQNAEQLNAVDGNLKDSKQVYRVVKDSYDKNSFVKQDQKTMTRFNTAQALDAIIDRKSYSLEGLRGHTKSVVDKWNDDKKNNKTQKIEDYISLLPNNIAKTIKSQNNGKLDMNVIEAIVEYHNNIDRNAPQNVLSYLNNTSWGEENAEALFKQLNARRNKLGGKAKFEDYNDILKQGDNALTSAFSKMVGRNMSVNDLNAIMDAYNSGPVTPMYDGIASGNGSPMTVGANTVTPVHDGIAQIARTDPTDSALFAKDGGPFDTLFNDVFGEIGEIHSALSDNMVEISPLDAKPSMSPISYDVQRVSSSISSSPSSVKVENVKVEISGRLDLSSNGKSVNIIDELNSNPILLRTLSEMLGQQISKSLNGGKANNTNNMGLSSYFI